MKYVIQHPDGTLALVEAAYETAEMALVHDGPRFPVDGAVTPEDLGDFMVSDGRFRRKPPAPIQWSKDYVKADAVDTVMITGLPPGTRLVATAAVEACCSFRTYPFEINDGTAEMVFTEPGDYEITLHMREHKTVTRTIHAL